MPLALTPLFTFISNFRIKIMDCYVLDCSYAQRQINSEENNLKEKQMGEMNGNNEKGGISQSKPTMESFDRSVLPTNKSLFVDED